MHSTFSTTYTSGQYNHKQTENTQSKNILVREGDWVCYFCGNYNYAFRLQCNRCQIEPAVVDYQYPNFYYEQPQIMSRESKWKIDDNMTHDDPMSNNHFQRVLFLTPPKNRRNSSIGKRKVLGNIENLEGVSQKQKMEESLKWVSKIIDD